MLYDVACMMYVRNLNLYLILVLTTVLVVTYVTNTTHDVKERKKESEHRDKLCSFPNAYCLLVIISLFVNNERINTIPDIIYIFRYSPVYLVL
jgi:hypothetical protein